MLDNRSPYAINVIVHATLLTESAGFAKQPLDDDAIAPFVA
jgi:hypothetical protein